MLSQHGGSDSALWRACGPIQLQVQHVGLCLDSLTAAKTLCDSGISCSVPVEASCLRRVPTASCGSTTWQETPLQHVQQCYNWYAIASHTCC